MACYSWDRHATLGALSDIVESLRADQSDLAAVIDAAGVNAEDIEIQRNALTSLVTQAGLISAADTSLTSARGYFDTLTEIYDQAGTTSDATTLASLQTDFETAATSVVSALNNASYGDANLLTDAADDLTATIDKLTAEINQLKAEIAEMQVQMKLLGAIQT